MAAGIEAKQLDGARRAIGKGPFRRIAGARAGARRVGEIRWDLAIGLRWLELSALPRKSWGEGSGAPDYGCWHLKMML